MAQGLTLVVAVPWRWAPRRQTFSPTSSLSSHPSLTRSQRSLKQRFNTCECVTLSSSMERHHSAQGRPARQSKDKGTRARDWDNA